MSKKKNKIWIAVIVGALGVAGAFVVFGRFAPELSSSSVASLMSTRPKVTVYRSATCGCCGNYVAYLKKNGFEVETEFVDSTDDIQAQSGVPGDMESCHTTIIGDYVVEGHVPIEAIAKLLEEKPALKGIAIPGMPLGSPGMPGAKRGAFSVYGFKADGSSDIFTSI